MSDPASVSESSLRIVHILRSPMGGLFRHVLDLCEAQIARGHRVGIIADDSTGGRHAAAILTALAPRLALGLTRIPMHRDPHPSDLLAMRRVSRVLDAAAPDVVHGHGAKGALYARLPALLPFAPSRPIRVYTPHGGSLHYDRHSAKGILVLGIERLLARKTDLILFESLYAADRFRAIVGQPSHLVRIVHNGLGAAEFTPVTPHPDAAEVVYVGEMRHLKGVDVLLEALAQLTSSGGRPVRAVLVGSGPDRDHFIALAEQWGLAGAITFRDPMPARDAFALGQVLVVPSRAESLPYIVLEAAAAQVSILASRVGGIPEIFGGAEDNLVPAGDPAALASALAVRLAEPPRHRVAAAVALSRFIETRFAVGSMADDVIAGYRDALAGRRGVSPSREGASSPSFPLRIVGS